MREISRRAFLSRASLLPLAALLPRGLLRDALANASAFRFLTDHEAAVVREATARLIPGPQDDPAEIGHPGAREADVVRYVDTMLGAFALRPPRIHAGGPFSDRSGSRVNHMERFVPLSRVQRLVWERRIAELQKAYREGIVLLDGQAGGDFAAAPPPVQDAVLASAEATDFRNLLFTHAIEGMYAVPEYGGNAGLAGWSDIEFPGDTQPRGYTPAQVAESDGPDPVVADAVVDALLGLFDQAIRAMGRPGGR